MSKKFRLTLYILTGLTLLLGGCGSQQASHSTSSSTKIVRDNGPEKKAIKLEKANVAEKKRLDREQTRLNQQQTALKKEAHHKKAKKSAKTNLSTLSYNGQQEITIDGNNPHFSHHQLSTAKGAWQTYHNLDSLNRVTGAAALLNQSLMPKSKREALTVDPTGWHNKRTAHGWLYNRSHLIGYQFTGQNNNMKNLMTGTRTLNNPSMLHNEMDVATYLKASRKNYVRYTVTPIFKGNELVARGVQMRAQSIGSNAVRFNVYIFNIEPGYHIDYATGYSRAS
ncbi:DNA/RNA non-specific endonuclease [Levilactobacillus lindianensis]|uniref:DNA/RNA non-specific endonuclease n=1 Tax=Levilactobacillus lindianensis TaxID=2486018 RepID=UPI000F743716|nr:DNA/RNA non-specific endonuclease [Levilactobacillus lindianensis]